jgi:hypothetical protein
MEVSVSGYSGRDPLGGCTWWQRLILGLLAGLFVYTMEFLRVATDWLNWLIGR